MKELTISLNGESVTPLYEQIYQYLKQKFKEGRYSQESVCLLPVRWL